MFFHQENFKVIHFWLQTLTTLIFYPHQQHMFGGQSRS